MKHALGLFGVVAASILLAVSAAMNWQFGFSLGKSEFDSQILLQYLIGEILVKTHIGNQLFIEDVYN